MRWRYLREKGIWWFVVCIPFFLFSAQLLATHLLFHEHCQIINNISLVMFHIKCRANGYSCCYYLVKSIVSSVSLVLRNMCFSYSHSITCSHGLYATHTHTSCNVALTCILSCQMKPVVNRKRANVRRAVRQPRNRAAIEPRSQVRSCQLWKKCLNERITPTPLSGKIWPKESTWARHEFR